MSAYPVPELRETEVARGGGTLRSRCDRGPIGRSVHHGGSTYSGMEDFA